MARAEATKRADAARAKLCAACGRPLAHSKRGRPARHCSPACRQRAYRRRRHGEQTRRLVRLVEGDARAFLCSLADESVDLVVTDPPYRFQRGSTYFRRWFPELDDDNWPPVFAQLYRVLKRDTHAYVFCDWPTASRFSTAAGQAGFRVQTPIIWDKEWIGLGSGAWRPSHEFILWLEKGSRPGNSRARRNVLRARRPHRGYPTEKPVAALRELIAQSSSRGELVLDPFCGSGNVGRAARELGRRALLCDVDAAFAAGRLRLAIDRLAEGAT